MSDRLVFVYNVDGSPAAMLGDLVKAVRDGQTDCRLCDVTFGRLMKDRSWKRFVADLPLEVDFQLRSTFRREHRGYDDHEFPAAFLIGEDGVPRELISAPEIDAVDDLDALRVLVSRSLAARPQIPATKRPSDQANKRTSEQANKRAE